MNNRKILYIILFSFLLVEGCADNVAKSNEIEPTLAIETTATTIPAVTAIPLEGTPKEAFQYSINNGEVIIEGLRDVDLVEIFVPDRIDGYPVVKIADAAFYGCTNLKGINLPNSLEEIGESAFQYTGIEQVIIPDGVKTINALVFADCKKLNSLYVGEGVQFIDISAFSNCSILCDIVVAEKNKIFTSCDEAGRECNAIIYVATSSVTLALGGAQTVIPENVENILRGAFYGRENLTKIVIPKNVNTIGKYSAIATGINGTMPTADSVGVYSSVYEYGAFQYCVNLEEIIVDKDNKVYTSRDDLGNECNVIIDIDDKSIVQGCKNSIIPNNVTEIDDFSFFGTGIESVLIPENISRIGRCPFGACSNLTELVVDKRNMRYFSCDTDGKECNIIIDIEYGCIIQGCSNSIIPEGEYNELIRSTADKLGVLNDEILEWIEEEPIKVEWIGEHAFYACDKLNNIVISSDILGLGKYSFMNCNSLEKVLIEEGLETIGESVFRNCTNLREIILPDTVSQIDKFAFFDCDSIESIELPKGITEIEPSVFVGCDKLKCITIPASVTIIDNRAFLFCTNLTTVYTPANSYAEQWAIENGYEVINIR